MASPGLQLAAAHVLRDVIDQGRSLDNTLALQKQRLKPDQHGALMEIAYGGCRHYSYLDGLLAKLLQKPIRSKDRMVHFLLVAGLYQLIYMRVPDHAAVNQTVKALLTSKQAWAKGLVNGVLREAIRRRDSGALGQLSMELSVASQSSLPEFIYQQILQAWPEQASAIVSASNEHPPLTLRVNRQKTTREDYLSLLSSREIGASATDESALGIVIEKPQAVESLPMFAEGWASVQDESAQLCTQIMALQPGLRVLDGCAAPGGKSGAMLEQEPGIALTAIDLPERVYAIYQNLERIGLQAEVVESDLEAFADWWDHRPWDRILLDVPCSGSGVMRRHPDIRHRRRAGDLERFADQQLSFLHTAWQMLAADGMLVYVTCSIFPVENDEVIGRFLESCADATVVPVKGFNGTATRYGIQRLPGIDAGDGFYYCRLVRGSNSPGRV